MLCIAVQFPVPNAGALACAAGEPADVEVSVDHVLGRVGIDGFDEEDCLAVGGTVEGGADPHPGACNGPVEVRAGVGAPAVPGTVVLAPDPERGWAGVPARISVESEPPCGDEGGSTETVLALVSTTTRVRIEDPNAADGAALESEVAGEAFDCGAWGEEDGPGRLVFAVPALHGFAGADVVTAFVFDDASGAPASSADVRRTRPSP